MTGETKATPLEKIAQKALNAVQVGKDKPEFWTATEEVFNYYGSLESVRYRHRLANANTCATKNAETAHIAEQIIRLDGQYMALITSMVRPNDYATVNSTLMDMMSAAHDLHQNTKDFSNQFVEP